MSHAGDEKDMVRYIDALMRAMREHHVDKLDVGSISITMTPGSYERQVVRVPTPVSDNYADDDERREARVRRS